MKLMVAGCSYSAISNTLPGTAWSERLASELGWDLVNLARQGCSNGAIRLQIDEIIRQRPDFAIVTPTFWDRMEIPAQAVPRTQHTLEQHLRDTAQGYDPDRGLDNVNYGHNHPTLISETIYSLAENHAHSHRPQPLSKDAHDAIRLYVDQIYDSQWKKQQDEWIIREGVYEMFLAGIKFLLVPVLLWPFDPHDQDQWRNLFPAVIPPKFVMSNEPESILPITGNTPWTGPDPGYHGSPESQIIIARNYYQRIQSHEQ